MTAKSEKKSGLTAYIWERSIEICIYRGRTVTKQKITANDEVWIETSGYPDCLKIIVMRKTGDGAIGRLSFDCLDSVVSDRMQGVYLHDAAEHPVPVRPSDSDNVNLVTRENFFSKIQEA